MAPPQTSPKTSESSPFCLCDHAKLVPAGPHFSNGRQLLRCRNCGLRQLFPYPVSSNQDNTIYENPAYLSNITEAEYFGYFMAIYDSALRGVASKDSEILDFGAGHCFYHKFLGDLGYTNVSSLEINGSLADHARKELGLRSVFTSAAQLTGRRFDVILANQVIEHVFDPRRLVEVEFLPLLKDGGHIVFTVPNADSWNRRVLGTRWIGYSPAEHIWFFSRQDVRRIFEASGALRVASAAVKSAVNTRHDRFVPRSLPKRLYYRSFMRLFEACGRGDQLIVVLKRAPTA